METRIAIELVNRNKKTRNKKEQTELTDCGWWWRRFLFCWCCCFRLRLRLRFLCLRCTVTDVLKMADIECLITQEG